VPTKVDPYAEFPGEKVTLHHPDLDVTQDVPEEAVEVWEESGWKKASAKVAKAAEKEEE
jgi:hypothetical protein